MPPRDNVRQQMASLDRLTSAALCRRCTLVVAIAELKWRHGWPLRDYAREREMLSSLIASGRRYRLTGDVVMRLFCTIIEASLNIQAHMHRGYELGQWKIANSLSHCYPEEKIQPPKSALCHLRNQISQIDHLLLKLLAKRHNLLTSTSNLRTRSGF